MRLTATIFLGLCNWASAAEPDFDREIRPILSDVCFQCHGPDEAKRKGDLRLDTREGIAGLNEGELLKRITSTDPDEKMPPPAAGGYLKGNHIAALRGWIAAGAAWKPHWSFVAPSRPKIPAVSRPDWVRNPIDAFILARLDAEKLAPSPPADRRLLARRAHLDITGLPPAPEELERFLARPIGESVADLLGTPAHGEKMAYRWLDAARYADTSGYQNDGWRDMWRWRDWVIAAFQHNKPFDQFTIEQIAGDLLPGATLDQIVATGFNRNHRANGEGGVVPEEFQVEYVVDRVDTTFAVWQGLTMGCARCHNHKYDPLTQRDYYQVFAAFNNIPEYGRARKDGNSAPFVTAPTAEQSSKLKALRAEEAAALAAYHAEAAKSTNLPAGVPKGWTMADGRLLNLSQGAEIPAGKAPEFGYFDAFSLGAWILANPGDSGTILSKMVPEDEGAGYSLHLTEQGTLQANFSIRWLDDSLRVETDATIPRGVWTHVFMTYSGLPNSGGVTIFIDGQGSAHRPHHDFLNQNFAQVEQPLRVGRGMADFGGKIREALVYDRALEADEVSVLAAEDTEPAKVRRFWETEGGPEPLRTSYRHWLTAKRAAEAHERSLPTVMVMKETMPRETRMLSRGQYDQPGGEPLTAGVPAALPPLQKGAPANRLGIARWLVSPDNPLTARVIVNRLWRDVFGDGLVKTAEDFGVQGERPSHPELLDWLAIELVESGWNLRHVLTLMLTSNTYGQSSRVDPALLTRDPENRLLARGPRFRLPAEAIRDQALAVSGLLRKKIGGPSVKPYQPADLWKDIASDMNYTVSTGDDLYRRSLYTYWKRTAPPPMMVNFDANGRETCDVALRRTNTPLQALNLMNDVTYIEAARVLAERATAEPGDGSKILGRLYRMALSREPSPDEGRILLASQATYLARYAENAGAARSLIEAGESPVRSRVSQAELAAWTMVASTLLNLDEWVTKE
jgi:hypothetical protein